MKKILFVVLVLSMLCVLFPTSAISNTDTIVQSFNIPYTFTNWTETLNVVQFDPALGTLNSVTFELTSGLIKSSLTAINTGTSMGYVTRYSLNSSVINVTGPDSTLLFTGDWGPQDIVIGSFSNWVQVPVGQTVVLDAGPFSVSGSAATPPPANYPSLFTGLGTVPVTLNTDVWFTIGSSGPVQMQLSTQASADMKVTYEYTPIPEPASMLVLGTGLAGLLGFARRRRS